MIQLHPMIPSHTIIVNISKYFIFRCIYSLYLGILICIRFSLSQFYSHQASKFQPIWYINGRLDTKLPSNHRFAKRSIHATIPIRQSISSEMKWSGYQTHTKVNYMDDKPLQTYIGSSNFLTEEYKKTHGKHSLQTWPKEKFQKSKISQTEI